MAGYWLVRSSAVKDIDAQREYGRLWRPIAQNYQATIIAGQQRQQECEGKGHPCPLLVHFPSYELAVQCYADPAYQQALKYARQAYDRELIIIEGTDAPFEV